MIQNASLFQGNLPLKVKQTQLLVNYFDKEHAELEIPNVENILENELSDASIWKMYHREEILISVTVHGKSPLQPYEKGPHETELKFLLQKEKS